MANRYLKATGNWNDNNTWSATDGGAAGATYPLIGDSVFLTANGNGLTLTLAGAEACASFTASGGCTATMAGTQTLTVGGNVTLLATMTVPNTITWTVTGTGNFNGSTLATLGAINLNGTAHTLSGAFTNTVLTRTGTATKTDTLTCTSGTTLTCTTFAMIGNSITNRLLVQSSTLGTPATITTTNWTGSANVDIMDITVTNPVDLSAITGGSGDCQGNTDITFTTAAAQISAATGNWSNPATWADGVGTDRVPLPQDDVSVSHSVTMDEPRAGKSITFIGTPTVTTTAATRELYGSLTCSSGMNTNFTTIGTTFRGRDSYSLTCNGKSVAIALYAVNGTLTVMDSSGSDLSIYYGTLTLNNITTTNTFIRTGTTATKVINLGSSVVTLTTTAATSKVEMITTGLTFNAGTSTIILTNSGVNAQTFAGGGLTYNNVQVAGAGNYALTITGSNTFNNFHTDASSAAKTIKFTDGTTQTVTTFTRDSGTNVVTLTGTSTAGWNIVKSGTGVVAVDYMDISYSNAS